MPLWKSWYVRVTLVSRRIRRAIKRAQRSHPSAAGTIESFESPLAIHENRLSPLPFQPPLLSRRPLARLLLRLPPSFLAEADEEEEETAFLFADKYAGHDACFGSDICFRIECSLRHIVRRHPPSLPPPFRSPFPTSPLTRPAVPCSRYSLPLARRT